MSAVDIVKKIREFSEAKTSVTGLLDYVEYGVTDIANARSDANLITINGEPIDKNKLVDVYVDISNITSDLNSIITYCNNQIDDLTAQYNALMSSGSDTDESDETGDSSG